MKSKKSKDIDSISARIDSTSNGYDFNSKDAIVSIKLDHKNSDLKNGENAPEDESKRHLLSYVDTMLHIFKGNIGSGLLAMGDAYKNGGLIFAPIMTVFLAIVSVHAQHILLNCSDEMRRRTKSDTPPKFAETVELCFATGPPKLRGLSRSMNVLVNVFLCVTQLGFCCVYIVFIATNVKNLLDQYGFKVQLGIHMIFVVIPILLVCLVRNLKYLTPFSTLANAVMAVGVAIVIYEASLDLPPITTRDYIASWKQLPLFFATAIYAFEGIGLVLPLKNDMRHPETFQRPCGVLNLGMVIIAFIFIVVGFLGYLKWGNDVQGSLTLNMLQGHWLSTVVQVLIAVGMVFTYPLQFYVPIDIMWPGIVKKLGDKITSPVATELVFRSLMVCVTLSLAEAIPQLGLIISLVGAVSSTALALIFPPLIELVMKSQAPGGGSCWCIFKNISIILLGIFIFLTGTYESVTSIIRAFQF